MSKALISSLKLSSIPFSAEKAVKGRIDAVYDRLLSAIGDASVVMIGEASHGTHEFYHHRAEITKKLIQEKGFDCVCVEGDWPDAYKINRFVRGRMDVSIKKAFATFQRFPTWMWRNTVVTDFSQWLRDHNSSIDDETLKVGFYGLDLYSLHASAHEVIDYLMQEDPVAARRARSRYSVFDHFADDPQSYGMAAAFGMSESCQEGVLKVLLDMQKREADLLEKDGIAEVDKAFCARINASVVKDAEEYYRGMFTRKNTWNIRDKHMANTLDDLLQYISKIREKTATQANIDSKIMEKPTKAVVWAHNSHLGDAKHTEFSNRGEKNIGQFVRQKYGHEKTYNIGFTSHTGTVTAAHEWDDPASTMNVRVPDQDTFEHLFHQVGGDYALRFRTNPGTEPLTPEEVNTLKLLKEENLNERAIGVIYRPKTERQSHLFHAKITEQFDAVIHLDRTTALEPVEVENL